MNKEHTTALYNLGGEFTQMVKHQALASNIRYTKWTRRIHDRLRNGLKDEFHTESNRGSDTLTGSNSGMTSGETGAFGKRGPLGVPWPKIHRSHEAS